MKQAYIFTLLASSALAFPATAAMAQEAAPAQGATASTPGEIVVTGTRLATDGIKAPTPVTAVSTEQLLKASPGSLADALNQLPQLSNSSSSTSYFQTNADSPSNGNYLNLRGIGTSRALILFDGQRAIQTSSSGGVDVNTLPQMLVKRVEIVTAGASATYGSDAVSGVVNYVLDRKFKGLKYEASSGVSTFGDAPSWKVGLAGGAEFAQGKGHIIASVEHYQQAAINSRSARRFGDGIYTLVGAGTAADPLKTYANARFNFSSFGGLIPASGQTFKNGQLSVFNPGTPIGNTGQSVGGDGAHFDGLGLTGSVNTTQAFSRISYEITPEVEGFLQGSFARAENGSQYGNDFNFGGLLISPSNAFLSAADQATLAAVNGGNAVAMSRYNRDLGLRTSSAVNTNYNITAGLSGSLGGYKWNVSYEHGRNSLTVNANEFDNRKLYAALDAVKDGSGNIVCRVTLTNPDLYPGCSPLNLFGEGSPSAAAAAYVRGTSIYKIVNQMDDIVASISGSPFSLWAGPVSLAVGGEYRHQSLNQSSNSDPALPVDFTGIRNVPNGATAYDWTNVGSARGSYNVKEAFGEAEVPLLNEGPLGKSLTLNGAVRFTDYSTSGSVVTWKTGFVYEPFDDLRIRATQSRDIRAPTLYNFFATASVSANAVTTASGSVNVIQTTVGNRNLKPEKGDTTSIGIAYTPHQVPGLRMSLDFYHLRLKDAISTNDAQTTYNDCVASNGTSPVCALISYAADGKTPIAVALSPVNSASLMTEGYDFEASYRHNLGAGNITFRALTSYVPHIKLKTSALASDEELAGTANTSVDGNASGYPKWRGNFSVNYNLNNFNLFVQERWIGGYLRSTRPTFVIDSASNKIPDVFYTDVTMSVDIADGRFQPFFNVSDLFNRQAPLYASYFPGVLYPAAQSVHSVMGRYFTVGIRGKF
ncbi:TonB-dependent receptor [Novosphingobium sp. SG720]|uniref:TonB-dependent receptor domain-containing protein n=2 Tax=Novosphingobium TaxID=165696 RepID=UPI0014489C7C|nr:TonB-dependent receptor [Novosphingobium sp. SG720]NMN07629.1 outer membrane receptor protein involved in Fe transport [Novosphingobium sp. SG919]